MADDNGPWGAPRRGEPGHSGTRFYIAIALIVAGAIGIAELWRLFPGALSEAGDQGYFLQMAMLAVLVGSGIVYSRRFNASEVVRNLAIWAGIGAVLVFGYTYYHQIRETASGIGSELVPGYAANVDANTIALTENEDGDFSVHGTVNGKAVEFMIDTGASDIVLSPADAERIGIDMSALNFNRRYETANGEGRGARHMLDQLQIGPVKLFDVPVSINAAKMHSSLLGMAFLRRMKSFEMKGRKLYLRWR